MSGPRCTARHCGEIMVDRIDAIGRVVFDCPKCPRTKQGLCRDCPRARAEGSLRCAGCRKKRKQAQYRACWENNKPRYLAHRRQKYQTNAEFRARVLARAKHDYDTTEKTPLVRAYNAHKQRSYRARKRAQRQQRAAA